MHELMRQLNTNFWIFELILISRNESDEISWLKSPTPEITIETTPENELTTPVAPKRKYQNMASIILNIGSFTNYVDKFLSFLATYPLRCYFLPYRYWQNHFWTTYLPISFFNIVCERHLISTRITGFNFFQHFWSGEFNFFYVFGL